MGIQRALAGLEMYSSMTILPFEGVKGLSLYLKHRDSDREQVFVDLRHCKEFCDVVKILFEDPKQAIQNNVSVYRGMQEVYKDESKRREVSNKVSGICNTIEAILQGGHPAHNQIEENIVVLTEVTQEAEKKLNRLDYEKVILGKYTTI